ncbi:MAG: hypothetical protein Q9163_000534 [Psora crenata]
MAQVAGGSHNLVDLRTLSSDDTPFSDELFANLANYAENDNCDGTHYESIVDGATATPTDIHRAANIPLSQITEGVDVSPNSIKPQSQEGFKNQVLQTFGKPTVPHSNTLSASPIKRPVSLPSIELVSGPHMRRTRRLSSLRNEYKQAYETNTDTKLFRAVPHHSSGSEHVWEQSTSPIESHHTQMMPPVNQLEDPFFPKDFAHSGWEGNQRSSANLQHALEMTDNNTRRHQADISTEQYTPISMASPHCRNTLAHGLPIPYSGPDYDQQTRHPPNTPYHGSPPSCTATSSMSTSAPLTSIVHQGTPALSSRTALTNSVASIGPKHERSSHVSRSLPRLHEMASVGPQHFQLANPPRRQTTAVARQNANQDKILVSCLVTAMRDMDETEDNPGMLDTWLRIMKEKVGKIEKEIMYKAHGQKPEPLGEKRPIYVYESFKQRFDATQKTVCKHLLEDPYVYQVVDDPMHALRRVRNNRRVNQQKKEAIDEGRKRLGLKGQGKGIALQPTAIPDGLSEPEGDDQDSAGQPLSEPSSEYIAPSKSQRPRRAATKRAYVTDDYEDGGEHTVHTPPRPKKAKRHTRSNHPPTRGSMVGSSATYYSSEGDSDRYTSSPMTPRGLAYAPPTNYPPSVTHSSPTNTPAQYCQAPLSHDNGQVLSHLYGSLPFHTHNDAQSVSAAQAPSFLNSFNMQDYRSQSSDAYSDGFDPDQPVHNDHMEVPYDPFSN